MYLGAKFIQTKFDHDIQSCAISFWLGLGLGPIPARHGMQAVTYFLWVLFAPHSICLPVMLNPFLRHLWRSFTNFQRMFSTFQLCSGFWILINLLSASSFPLNSRGPSKQTRLGEISYDIMRKAAEQTHNFGAYLQHHWQMEHVFANWVSLAHFTCEPGPDFAWRNTITTKKIVLFVMSACFEHLYIACVVQEIFSGFSSFSSFPVLPSSLIFSPSSGPASSTFMRCEFLWNLT